MNAKLNIQSKHKENRLFRTRFIRFLIALAVMTVSTTSAWGQTASIKYLNYVGGTDVFEEATADATQITSSSEYLGGNYYVEGDVTFSSTVILRDDTQIILCDGTTLTINATDGYGIILDTYRLTIYAQSSGSHAGKLIINCNNDGISGSSNVTINGGIISVTSASYEAISCGNFTVNGGAVTAVGNGSSYNGISSRDFTINGGKVSATGKMDGIIGSSLATHGVTINGGQVYAKGDDDGIYSEVGINLGWTNAEDYIESNSYTTLSPINIIKDFYINGSTTLSAGTIAGRTSSFTIDDSSIAGKRLTPNTTDPIYTISLGTGITGGTVEVDKTKAFVGERVAVNVTPPDGYYLASLTCKYGSTSVDITQQANDNVFTMPASDVTVNATFAPPIKVAYVDADGNLHDDADGSTASTADDMATAYILGGYESTLGKTSTAGEETWYVTTSETATFTNTIKLNGDVHIILADGTTMKVEPSTGNGIFADTYNLYIHGQQNRSGKLNVVASGYGIYSLDMNIYGAEVMAKSTSQDAIHADNDMNIFDAKVSATGDKYGVYAERYMNITGGQVKAVGGSTSDGIIDGIFGPINLTWKKSSDYLQSKGYGDDLTIAKGQYFYMTEVDTYGKQNPISGTISEGSINEDIPIGAKLVPALPVQGGSPYVGFFMTSGGWSLPGGVKAFTPQGYNLAAGTASLAEISGVPDGKTVILGSATDGGNLPSTFYLIGTTVENAASYESSYQANPFQSNFKTSETGLTLGEMIGDTDENTALILSDGSFKSFNYPSSLSQRPDPQHVFLIVSKWDMLTKGSSSNGGSSGARSIGIDTGATTGIKLTPVLSEGDGVWYSLDGRKLSVKPAAKGVYINKGKKYVVR